MRIALLLLAALFLWQDPPKAKVEEVVETLHGEKVADPYRWLEDGENKEVQAWADGQNDFTRSKLGGRKPREAFHKRIEELASVGRVRSPRIVGKRIFYLKRSGSENQPSLYCQDNFDGKSRRVLDVNTLSKDGTTAIDWWFPNRNGSMVAYGTSEGGSEVSTLRIRNVDDGKDLADAIPNCRAASVEWTVNSAAIYYTRYPTAGSVPKGEETYHRRVYFHKLGDDPAKDALVFGEKRAKEDWPTVSLSSDGNYVLVSVFQGWSKSEIYLNNLRASSGWQTIIEGVEASSSARIIGDKIYVLTNDGAPKNRVMVADIATPTRKDWKVLVPETDATIEDFVIVGKKMVLRELRDATTRLRSVNLDGTGSTSIELPTLGTVSEIDGETEGTDLVFDFTSFFVAPALYRLDASGKLGAFESVNAGIDPAAFEAKQVWYPSKDGTKIPMFVMHGKGVKLDGSNPTLLNGYGGFSISLSPYFGSGTMAWLERGGILAIPNLRGGGEYGEGWHQAGMLGRKQNVFDDFISAAEWLIKEKYTSTPKLAISGGSNGGLLVGAVLTQRPELFRAVVCSVPLLDMVRYPKFQIARLWIPEYGNPETEADFKWLYAYSPYHHVKEKTAYPAVMLMTADHDTRVDPLHARKMCARLQAATSSGQPILLRMEKKAGHGAGKPLAKALEELTDEYGFLMWQLGME